MIENLIFVVGTSVAGFSILCVGLLAATRFVVTHAPAEEIHSGATVLKTGLKH